MTLFEDFTTSDFTAPKNLQTGGAVYVFFWVRDGAEIPFYVGQTQRISGRMRDYYLANFSACTDFCVGEAIKHLQDKKIKVLLKYKSTDEPRKLERAIIRNLLESGVWLLNCLPRYDYKIDSSDREREFIHKFCDMFTG